MGAAVSGQATINVRISDYAEVKAALDVAAAEIERLRGDNAALVASKSNDWQTGYDTGCAMSHSIGCGAAQDHRDSLLAAVERVRALHQPTVCEGVLRCAGCGQRITTAKPWPCPTRRALDGAT